MCVDYRKLNAVTKRPVYLIPATQQLLDCLNGARFFTTLDLSQGYHQIPMAEDDIPKTAFATRRGQFEYKRMPFGLSTAPATFQRLMHVVFKNETNTVEEARQLMGGLAVTDLEVARIPATVEDCFMDLMQQ